MSEVAPRCFQDLLTDHAGGRLTRSTGRNRRAPASDAQIEPRRIGIRGPNDHIVGVDAELIGNDLRKTLHHGPLA